MTDEIEAGRASSTASGALNVTPHPVRRHRRGCVHGDRDVLAMSAVCGRGAIELLPEASYTRA
jgi:hypothetical protein